MTAPYRYEYKTAPRLQQRNALKRGAFVDVFGYRLPMGTGKSKVLLDNAAALHERGEIDALVIVCPKTVCLNWTRTEIPLHLPDRIKREVMLWEPRSRRRRTFESNWQSILRFRGLAILVMNCEALANVDGEHDLGNFLKARRALWALDESTRFKNAQTKRTKAALKLSPLAVYRRILSGAPITRSPMDLWGQCEFLRHGILGDSTFYSFRGRYAELRRRLINGREFQEVVGYRQLDQLRTIVESFTFYAAKEDCVDLPPKIYARRIVEATDEQKYAYREMRDKLEVEFADVASCTARNVLTKLLRLQQILCGWLPLDDGKHKPLKTNRIDALVETLEECEGSAIVWTPFRTGLPEIVKAIETETEETVVQIHGDVGQEDRQRAIEAFQSGKARFLVGTPQSGGIGLTLTAATTVVYFANTWDLEVRAQSEDRAHRIGQTQSVTYVDLVTPGTIDEKILNALAAKRALADEILGSGGRGILR